MAPLGHILNFYEDFDLSLGALQEAFCEILEGRLAQVEEKIDGQNLTFTVRRGKVETFYKGATWSRVLLGGRKIEDYAVQYNDRPAVAAAYIESHKALQAVVDSCPGVAERLFLNGRVIVNCEMIVTNNLNTVPYENDVICFVSPHAMDPDLAGAVSLEAYELFVNKAACLESKFRMKKVPHLKIEPVEESIRSKIVDSLESMMISHNLDADSTVGDLLTSLVACKISSTNSLGNWKIDSNTKLKISRRIALDDKSAFTTAEAKKIGEGLWDRVKFLESGPFRALAIAPFQKIFDAVAFETFKNTQFEIAPNDYVAGNDIREWVANVTAALYELRIAGPSVNLSHAISAISRIDIELFGKPVEGIVFPWRGETRKLTGSFTPINKLRGMFVYGKSPLKIMQTSEA